MARISKNEITKLVFLVIRKQDRSIVHEELRKLLIKQNIKQVKIDRFWRLKDAKGAYS